METCLTLAVVMAAIAIVSHFHAKSKRTALLVENMERAKVVEYELDEELSVNFTGNTEVMKAVITYGVLDRSPDHFLLKRRDDGSWRMKLVKEDLARKVAWRKRAWREGNDKLLSDRLPEQFEDVEAFERREGKWRAVHDDLEHALEQSHQARSDLFDAVSRR
jgi:hypothetical protein